MGSVHVWISKYMYRKLLNRLNKEIYGEKKCFNLICDVTFAPKSTNLKDINRKWKTPIIWSSMIRKINLEQKAVDK